MVLWFIHIHQYPNHLLKTMWLIHHWQAVSVSIHWKTVIFQEEFFFSWKYRFKKTIYTKPQHYKERKKVYQKRGTFGQWKNKAVKTLNVIQQYIIILLTLLENGLHICENHIFLLPIQDGTSNTNKKYKLGDKKNRLYYFVYWTRTYGITLYISSYSFYFKGK